MISKGILGLGEVSTKYYLEQIHQKYKDRNEKLSTCPFLLYQIDFQVINPFLPNQFSVLIPKIEVILNKISELGIRHLLVPNITLHETLDQIDLPLKIYNPLKLAVEKLQQNLISKICIFGTLYTMNSIYLRDYFKFNNIEITSPSENDQKIIDNFRIAVYNGTVTDNQILKYRNILDKYAQNDGVLIACTELSFYSGQNNSSCFDMADLQIEDFLN